jgi:uncharacterized repeat protein (TIGR01451 family)
MKTMKRILTMGTGKQLAFCTLIAAAIVGLVASGPVTARTGGDNLSAGNAAVVSKAPQIALANPSSKTNIAKNLLQVPMSFEENQGQTDSRVKFLSRGAGYTLFLTSSEAVLALNSANVRPAPQGQKAASGFGSNPGNPLSVGNLDRTPQSAAAKVEAREAGTEDVLRMQLVGANSVPQVAGVDETSAKSNYFIGKYRSKWRTNVSNFGKVRYASVYPGVDLVFYGNQRQLEYDFVVAPGADPRVITLGFPQANPGSNSLPLHINNDGDLVAHLSGGDVSFHKPVVYQTLGAGKNQTKRPVDGRYILKADGQAGFELGAYDHSRQVVIDPIVSFATYLGGSNEDLAMGIAADRYTDVVIAGSTRSADFPVYEPFEPYHPGTCGTLPCRDVFVSKFNPTGTTLQLSTYIGGSNDDVATQLVLDMAGDMFVVGYTLSTDFPVTPKAFQKTFGGGTVTGDGFVFELASKAGPSGGIEYASYLGGSGEDMAYGITVDYVPSATPNVYVVGSTTSTNFPTTHGAYQNACGLTKQGTCANGFASKVNPKGTALLFSTYLGGSGGLGDAAYGVAVDRNENVYISGITGSPNFPTTSGAYQTICGTDGLCNGTFDGFVTELDNVGQAIWFSTFLGGSGYDYTAGIALDSADAVYVSGNTTSTDFPTTASAAQTTFGGMSAGCSPTSGQICGDVTVTKLNPGLSTLSYSTYLGGSLDEYPGLSMAVDASGKAYVTGQTASIDFPLVSPFQPAYGGGASDAFVTIVSPTGTAFTSSSYLGGNGQDFGYRVALDSLGDIYVSGGTLSTNFPVKPGVFQTICGTDGNCNGGLMDAWAAKLVPSADMSVTNSGSPNPVQTGSNLTYTIVVKNNGPDSAAAVTMTDATPTGTTFESFTTTVGGCTAPPVGGTGTVTCTLGTVPNGSKATITMVVNVNAASGSTITDKASVSSTTYDPKKGNNAVNVSTKVN